MHFLPTILTALSLLLPAMGRESAVPVGLNAAVVSWGGGGACSDLCGATIHRPFDPPSRSRLFLESLDESALGEEDTDEIEPSAATSQIVFDQHIVTSILLSPSSPHRLHASLTLAPSILRC
jgi:hypothetical protein